MPRNSYASSQIPAAKADIPYGDYTKLVQGIFGRGAEMQAGKIADATGAAMDVALDFDPAFVVVWDATQAALWLKFPTLADDDSMYIDTAATVDTAGGITLGTLGAKKFSIGTDAKINTLHDVLHWVAWGFKTDIA